MKRINIIKSILFTGTLFLGVSCTNLDEKILDGYDSSNSSGNVDADALLQSAREDLRNFQDMGQMFSMNEMTTDALVGPTRGGDWDDNGKWRQFHVHTWAPDNPEIITAWNNLLTSVYKCNQVIDNSKKPEQVIEARYLRAFYYYNVVDLFGIAPYRESGSSLQANSKVWTRKEATAFIITELEAIVGSSPARTAGDPSVFNVDAVHFLLAKTYLNKAVFTSDNPASGTFTFEAADMTKVITHVNAITSSLSSDYWDNFTPNNNLSPELLFTSKNILNAANGNIQSRWRMGMHYNQTPGGWNGFATVAEYYDKFKDGDLRRNKTSASIITNFGNPIGFQYGQMYAPGGVAALQDRNSHPLFYTRELTMITGGATLETAGIRAQKYEPDATNLEKPGNDYVLMRYSDALLMSAEASLRGGTGGDATAALLKITTRAGIPAVAASLDNVLDQRARELWYEGWRRNDLIRFGKFLTPNESLRSTKSPDKYILFPVPADALFNPNIKQNPGY
jgi:hypothetical protein